MEIGLIDKIKGILKDRYPYFSTLMLAAFIALPMTITNVFAGICLAGFIIYDRFHNVVRGIKNDILPKLICVYFFLIVFTSLREATVMAALDIIIKRLLIILPLFFYNLKISAVEERRILSVYVVAVSISCVLSLIQTFTHLSEINSLYEFSWYLSNNSVFPSNYLAVYVAFAVIIMFYSFFSNPLFSKFLNAVLFVILFFYITLLGSRTAFFSMALICCGYFIIESFKKRRHIIYSVLMVVGLVLLVTTIPYFKSRITVLFTVGLEADARYYESLAAREILTENYLSGVGYSGTKQALVKEYERIGFHEGVQNIYNAHNEFIQSALIFGVFGFALVVILYITMILKALKTKKFLPLAFTLLFTLCSLTESLLERNKGIVFFVFFTGLLLIPKAPEPAANE